MRREDKTEALAMNHDTFSHNTRTQLKKVFDALRELMTPPDPPKRPIGFVTPEDKGKKAQARHKTLTRLLVRLHATTHVHQHHQHCD